MKSKALFWGTLFIIFFCTGYIVSLANASMIGDEVFVDRQYLSAQFDYHWGTETVTVAEGAGDLFSLSNGNNIFIDINSTTIDILWGPSSWDGTINEQHGATEHSITFSGIDMDIFGVSATTDIMGFDPTMVTFTTDSITFDYLGLSGLGGETLHISTNPTPEPGTFVLMGIGLLVMASVYRQRERA